MQRHARSFPALVRILLIVVAQGSIAAHCDDDVTFNRIRLSDAAMRADDGPLDAAPADAFSNDAAPADAFSNDAAPRDASAPDAIAADALALDATSRDASAPDAIPSDAAPLDVAPPDASAPDSTLPDAAPRDASPSDASRPDAGSCLNALAGMPLCAIAYDVTGGGVFRGNTCGATDPSPTRCGGDRAPEHFFVFCGPINGTLGVRVMPQGQFVIEFRSACGTNGFGCYPNGGASGGGPSAQMIVLQGAAAGSCGEYEITVDVH